MRLLITEHQNWYPDLSFVNLENQNLKFAVDLKTAYRDSKFPGHISGFTLGSHGAYFRNRTSKKNIQFPYGDYSGHFCLGIIYSRKDSRKIDETEIIKVNELEADDFQKEPIKRRVVTKVDKLRSIVSVIEDILTGNGIFARLGEEWFDEYWMNFGIAKMRKGRKSISIKRLEDFVKFKGGDESLIVPMETKKRRQ